MKRRFKIAAWLAVGGLLILFAFSYLTVWLENRRTQTMPPEILAAIDNAPALTLFSLDPETRKPDAKREFDRFPKLGQMEIREREFKRHLGLELKRLVESWPANAMMADCFSPRHAQRMQHQGHVYDLVICFECSHFVIERDGEYFGVLGLQGTSPLAEDLNARLQTANVPLPAPPR